MASESLTELKDKLQAANEREEEARLKKKEEDRIKAASEKAAAAAKADAEKAARKEKAELVAKADVLLQGPQPIRMVGDLAGVVVNEATYRGIQWALGKIGAQSPWWFTLIPLATSVPTYLIAYPRREEKVVRMFFRTWGLAGIITSVHDIASYLLGNRQQAQQLAAQAQQQVQQQAAQIAALQAQLQAAQPPAQQQPGQ